MQRGRPRAGSPAFCAYRNLPPERRSVRAAYESVGGTNMVRTGAGVRAPRTWRDWCRLNAWEARAEAHDREADRMAQAEFFRARKQALQSPAAAYRTALANALRGIQTKVDRDGAENLSEATLVRLLKIGAAGLGRVCATTPDQTVEVRPAPAGGRSSKERIEALLDLIAPPPGVEGPPRGA